VNITRAQTNKTFTKAQAYIIRREQLTNLTGSAIDLVLAIALNQHVHLLVFAWLWLATALA
jgi:hypothetical protein